MSEFNTPSHYVLSDGSDSMDALEKILGPEEFKGFLRGNAIKYLIRYKLKGGIEDLKKAMDYIERLVDLEEELEDEKNESENGSYLADLFEVMTAMKKILEGLEDAD